MVRLYALRSVLFAAAAVLAAASAGIAQQPAGPSDISSPPDLRSENGTLRARLVAAPGTFTLGGRSYRRNLYNGSYTPPTLRVSRGEWVELLLENRREAGIIPDDSARWTNLHYHGMTISPRPPADDIFLHINDRDSFGYSFQVPEWHAPGMFWYHPHPHGNSEAQVRGGMSGALIVEGLLELERFRQWRGSPELVMLLKDFPDPNDPDGVIKSINGQTFSSLSLTSGRPSFWRIGNVGANAYYNLKLPGHTFLVIARDGNPRVEPIPVDSLLIPPSSRVEVIVYGGNPGTYTLMSDAVDTGPAGDPNPRVALGVVTVRRPQPEKVSVPFRVEPDRALADSARSIMGADIVIPRKFVFSEDTVANTFFINNKMYDPNRVDTQVRVGGPVEEWVLVNDSDELHVFHIHQLDFIVTHVNGVPQKFTGFQDTVNLPYRQNGQPGEVRIRINFWNPNIVGKFVYHCHLLEHEDGGMMANIQVLPPL